ncbi:DUF1697 domain-containing protein [Gemmatimonas sp.]
MSPSARSAPATPTPTARVALLRGVNVGGKQVAMADLRAVAARLGFDQPGTLINSGNLVYRSIAGSSPAEDAQRLHDAIARDLDVTCTVFVRTRAELTAILQECPLREEATAHPSKLVVTVWDEQVTAAMRETFTQEPVTAERFVAGSQALYCWFPDGISASTAYEKATRRMGDHITARNWSTMSKLLARLELLEQQGNPATTKPSGRRA